MYYRPDVSRQGTQLPEMNQSTKGIDRPDAVVATSRSVIGFCLPPETLTAVRNSI
jgi:hypothetical protein